MTVSQVIPQWLSVFAGTPAIRSRWVEDAFEGMRTWTEAGSAVLSLSACSTEGRVALQRLARVSPAVGVSVVFVVVGQVLPECGLKFGGGGEVTVAQELTRQDGEP